MNVFVNKDIAIKYDTYYGTPQGKLVDELEKEVVSKFLRRIPRTQILEIGCGTGHWTSFFVESGFSVRATDISDAMLAVALEKNLSGVTFQKADAAHLPFENASFNVVTSITMLEFVENTESVLKEIYRILSPGGWLLLGCLNKNSELGKIKDSDDVFRNARFFSESEIRSYLLHFGEPETEQCVYFSQTFEILDNSSGKKGVEGSFIVACVQKTR